MSDQVPEAPAPEPVTSGGWTFSNSDGELIFAVTVIDRVVDVKLSPGMTYTKSAQMHFDRMRGIEV